MSFHLYFRQSRHEIPASVALAVAFVTGALLLSFLEDQTVFQRESGTFWQALHSADSFRVLVVFVQHPLQVLVGGAAGFDVMEMLLQGDEDIVWKDGFSQKRLQ